MGVGYALQEVDDRFDDQSEQGGLPEVRPDDAYRSRRVVWVASKETGRRTYPRTTTVFKSGGTRVNAAASVATLRVDSIIIT